MRAETTEELITAGYSTLVACRLTGYPRASFYRHHRTVRPARARAAIPQRDRWQPAALSDAERAQILDVLASEDYAELSVGQAFYRHWDTGCYIASRSSWYRVARDHAMVGDRRRQSPPGSGRSRRAPRLEANAPGEVWTWDITALKGPDRNTTWCLYVIVDLFSRYVVGWALHAREDMTLAKELIDRSAAAQGRAPGWLHSDNGSVMRSAPIAKLAGLLGLTLSFSRPRVSNDNPFSEALFKTVKYDLAFPGRFESYQEAHAYCEAFFTAYNTMHRHSGLGYHTPHDVHHGTTAKVSAARQATLETAYHTHPHRYRARPTPPRLPTRTHINKPLNLSHTG